METIKPTLSRMDIICAEQPAPPTQLVVFGASGDLTQRKLLPSLFDLYRRELLPEQFCVLGCGRTQMSDEQFAQLAAAAVEENSDKVPDRAKAFAGKCHYISGSYDDPRFYEHLKERIENLGALHKTGDNLIFYLSVPPFLYPVIVEKLGAAGLAHERKEQVRLIIEKPFGHDLQSAGRLNDTITQWFDESQIYRIDHYLGKETVQNILMFRFANSIFEPIWNRNYVDHVQMTIAESVGIEHRAGYYDSSGALRDMFQNHILSMLALVAMEPPVSFEADCVRDEKIKLLRAIRPVELKHSAAGIVRAQYRAGKVNGKNVCGYRREKGVATDSVTETFVAAKLFVDNWRWREVPFYVRTGKRLAAKDTEIAITFRPVPHSMFVSAGIGELPPNVLTLQIQPEEGMSLQFQAKRPGSKMCIGTLDMQFNYCDIFGAEMPEAYSRLLLDAMVGDQTLFNRYDSVEAAWKLFDPVLKAWQDNLMPLYEYPAGAAGLPAADKLIEADGCKWRTIAAK